jgi:hypothetical protein
MKNQCKPLLWVIHYHGLCVFAAITRFSFLFPIARFIFIIYRLDENSLIQYLSDQIKKMNMRSLLFLCGFLLSVGVSGQDFIVTIQGDTLVGDVKALTYGPDKKVQITEAGKKKVVYPFYKVKSFTVDDEVFQPVKGPQGYTFMKLLKAGYLSLYSFQSNNQNLYDGQFLLKMDGDGIEVPNITFKKGMKRFLDDCPTVTDKIESDLLNKKDLVQIIDEYNACITNAAASNRPVAESKPVVPAV